MSVLYLSKGQIPLSYFLYLFISLPRLCVVTNGIELINWRLVLKLSTSYSPFRVPNCQVGYPGRGLPVEIQLWIEARVPCATAFPRKSKDSILVL